MMHSLHLTSNLSLFRLRSKMTCTMHIFQIQDYHEPDACAEALQTGLPYNVLSSMIQT